MVASVAVAVSGGVGGAVAVAVPVAGLTKRFFNHIQKRFLNQCLGFICEVDKGTKGESGFP